MGNKFLDLVRESVIVQSVITLVLIGAVCYLAVTGQPIPDLLSTSMMLVLGFYFGQKTQQQISKQQRG